MKKIRFSFLVWTVVLLGCFSLNAQRRSVFTVSEQALLDSIRQTYLKEGVPEELASRRSRSVFESERGIQLRSSGYAPTPVPKSIWIDRDSVTGAPNASHAHDFTPEEFVKDIFVKGGREVADQAIRNVTLISSTWQGSMTDTWNNKGIMGPFGGDAGRWTNNDRELLYFDHGDTTTMVSNWDNSGMVKYFGIDRGFLLSTGPGLMAEGNNISSGDLGGGFSNWALLGGGTPMPASRRDPDLSPIARKDSPLDLGTLTSLEFDFRSFTDSVSFQFIFASTEFKNYSNTQYNDAFGFFVSGPGLTDAWGNSGDTINIARYPDGEPIAVNASNWGYRTSNNFDAYDPAGASPVSKTAYSGTPGIPGGSQNAIRPEYHVPTYQDTMAWLMEYDGHSIVLTAKARLQKGVWYHMKLALGNVSDQALGSGVYLKAGSLDLGKPEAKIPRSYIQTPYDSIYGWNSVYTGCDNTLELKFEKQMIDRILKVNSMGDGANAVYDADSGKYFNEGVKYNIPAGDSVFYIRFLVDTEKLQHGSKLKFISQFEGAAKRDTTKDELDLYHPASIQFKKFLHPAPFFEGRLEFDNRNGSPYMQRSVNDGLTWEFVRDTVTGEIRPFAGYQIENLKEDPNPHVIFREPNLCHPYDTVYIQRPPVVFPVLTRMIMMPAIPGAVCDHLPGMHFVKSREDFIFTFTPTGDNIGKIPEITTSRGTTMDKIGVKTVANPDGSYTVTIRQVQSNINIYVKFGTTANEIIHSGKIWTNGGDILYIFSDKADKARIYTIRGTLVQTFDIIAGSITQVSLPRGIYIIAWEGSRQRQKVVIK